MNIIWLCTECPYPPNSGGRFGTWNKLAFLSRTNKIFLFCVIDDKKDEILAQGIKEYGIYPTFIYRKKSMKSILYALKVSYPVASRTLPEIAERINESINNNNIDFIIIDGPQMVNAIPKKVLNNYKVIINQQNIEYLAMRSIASGIHNPIKRLIYHYQSNCLKNYENRIYKKVPIDLFTFLSISDKAYFERHFNLRNTLLAPMGVKIIASSIIESYKICFIAKMSYPPNEQGAKWLVNEVWPIIHFKVNLAELYLVGKDPSQELMNLNKTDLQIHVTGTVQDVVEYYNDCNVIVIPIMTGGGVKVKLLEALGHNKLVITTSKGIEGTEFIANEDVLVADTSDEFANLCVNAVLDPIKYEKIRQNGFNKMKEHYSFDSVNGSYETALKELLKKKKIGK